MDYKKIIKSRKTRLKILELLGFIPDKYMIQFQYRVNIHNVIQKKFNGIK